MSWTVYNAGNSELPRDCIEALATDSRGNLWVGPCVLNGGLVKFDGENWMRYTRLNSGLPDNDLRSLAEDSQGNLWIGSCDEVTRFDGVNWTVHNADNSELPPSAHIECLATDAQGNLWVGTLGEGLFVYREGGVILPGTPTAVEERRSAEVPLAFSLHQNYPNPFNPETTISYDVAKPGTVCLSVYALTGQLVRTLVEDERSAGSYSVLWDGRDGAGRDVGSGVYLCRMEAGDYHAARKLVFVQ